MPNLCISDDHIYTLGDQVLPSVTQVLQGAGLYTVSKWGDIEYCRDLGKAVHLACQLWDEDDLDYDDLDPVVIPYLDGWIKFKEDAKVEIIQNEQMLYHPVYLYAGTIDRVCTVHGRLSILDIKTGVPHPSTAIQTAAYRELTPVAVQRVAVYLNSSGSYKMDTYTDSADWNVFAGALTVYRWLQGKGLL